MTAKIGNLKNPVRSSWIRDLGCRLDAPPFVSGALEARKTLDALNVRKDQLASLTRGGIDGIYHAGREGRTWVESPEFGVPFLGSSDILSADLSHLPLMSREQISRTPRFLIREGWTLITRSGTIGKTAYCRPEMDGLACSEHVMRVVPDEDKVTPGYLYAFISSKYGIPIVVSGTYGSIIQSIEPQHIATLPVPRFGLKTEQLIGKSIVEAGSLRLKAAAVVKSAIQQFHHASGLSELPVESAAYPFSVSCIKASDMMHRFDAFFHSDYHRRAVQGIVELGPSVTVGEIASSVIEPGRFRRIKADDSDRSVPFFGTSAIMTVDPQPSYQLMRSHPNVHECIVGETTVLIPRSGQVSGIIGSAILPFGKVLGGAVSEDAIRINCGNSIDAGFLFVALSSEYGRRQLKARTFGSSIPHLDVKSIRSVILPRLEPEDRQRIGKLGFETSLLRSQAILLENRAIALVEQAIKENA